MSEPAGDRFSWGCPSCGRRVPTRFQECRCGFQKPERAPVVGEETAPPRKPSGPSASLLLILGAAIGLGIAVYIVQSQKPEPAAASRAPVQSQRALSGPPEPIAQAPDS